MRRSGGSGNDDLIFDSLFSARCSGGLDLRGRYFHSGGLDLRGRC